jgi:hypothetical protein
LRAGLAAVVVSMSALWPPIATGNTTGVTTSEEKITWSVTPASESGPDGRSWIELTIDPGERIVEHLAVRNLSETSATFELHAADGYITHTGRFNMLPRTAESAGSGLWIDVEASVDIDAGEMAIVPFTITVPDNATPGDHAAGVAASVYSVQDSAGGAQVGLDSRVGFRVMTRVTGELNPSLTVAGSRADHHTSWNPFSPGHVTTELELVNDGNTRLSVSGTASAAGSDAPFGGSEPGERIELLPGDRRTVTVVLGEVWPTFVVPVTLLADVEMASADGTWSALPAPVSVSATAWAIPWPQLAVLAGITLIVGALAFRRGRNRRHVEDLLARARAEGREQALANSAPAGATPTTNPQAHDQ